MTHLVTRAFKYPIYPNKNQRILIEKTFGCCRFVYNHFLAQTIKDYKETGKSTISAYSNQKTLTQLKKLEEYEFLREVDSQALNQVAVDLQRAYENFFRICKERKKNPVKKKRRRNKKKKKPEGFPSFKKKSSSRKSYHLCKNNESDLQIKDNKIRIPKVGWVKIDYYRPHSGRVLSGTLSKTPSENTTFL